MDQVLDSSAAPRIAIFGDSINSWTGGIEFLRFCVSALSSTADDQPQRILLSARSDPNAPIACLKLAVKTFVGIRNSPFAETPRGRLMESLRDAGCPIAVIHYRNSRGGLADAMGRCDAHVLLPCPETLGSDFPRGWVGYIPDLQHKRMPHWFQEEESRHRDKKFTTLLDEASAVVVNSASVVSDIQEFYSGYKARIFALPYCPPVRQVEFPESLRLEVRSRYTLPERYFLISNQFWVHKSHETAFRALRRVREAGYDVGLVCTGNTSDYRWPEHLSHLMEVIEENRMREHIRILGQVPKRDQLAIMSESLAVIQPSLFEGGPGGGAVYDAVSLNKPCIVSDIAVNREIDIGEVRFFAAGSQEDLAAKMIEMLVHPPEMQEQEQVSALLRSRQAEFAAVLRKAARVAVGRAPR